MTKLAYCKVEHIFKNFVVELLFRCSVKITREKHALALGFKKI